MRKIVLMIGLLAVINVYSQHSIKEDFPSDSLNWDFGQFANDKSQGWSFHNFTSVKVFQEQSYIQLTFSPAQNEGRRAELKQASYFKRNVKAENYKALEVKLRASADPAGADLKLAFEWRRRADNRKTGRLVLPIECDGQFHVYTFNVTGHPDWEGEPEAIFAMLFPELSADAKSATLDVDYIRFVPSDYYAALEPFNVAERRLDTAEMFLKGAVKRKIPMRGAARQLQELKAVLARIKPEIKIRPANAATKIREFEQRYIKFHKELETLRRFMMVEESWAALADTIKHRTINRQPVSDALTEQCNELHRQLTQIKSCFSSAQYKQAEQDIAVAEEQLQAAWNNALSGEAANFWQKGLSDASYGRNGWAYHSGSGNSLLFPGGATTMMVTYFQTFDGTHQRLNFEPVGGIKYEFEKALETNWVYGRYKYRYETKGGNVEWIVGGSLVSPGSFLETNAKALRFTTTPGAGAPTKILIQTRNGAKIINMGDKFDPAEMSENWMLLLTDNRYRASPWMLVLQQCPQSLDWSKSELVINYRYPAGMIGITKPWGVQTLTAEFSKDWQKAPDEVVEQCRKVARMMICYPVGCDEYFEIDRAAGRVEITNVFSYREMHNQWNLKGEKTALVPPMLATAVACGYQGQILTEVENFNLPTVYGPWWGAKGDRITYSLPIPDLRNPTPTHTDRFPVWQYETEQEAASDNIYPAKWAFRPRGELNSGFHIWLYAWNLLDNKAKQDILENVRFAIADYCDTIKRLGTFKRTGEFRTANRVEPYTGLPYMVYGWNRTHGDSIFFGDIANFAGAKLTMISLYGKYSGDWKFIKQHWESIKRIFEVSLRRADWGIMGSSCMENYVLHNYDMGVDSWTAPVAMAQLAAVVGDRRTEDMALYMATKHALPLISMFYKRMWDEQFYNRWDLEKDIAEVGYTEMGYFQGSWSGVAAAAYSMIGIVFSPEALNLRRDFANAGANYFQFYLLDHYLPRWYDPKYGATPQKKGANNPGHIARHALLREALGDSNENLIKYIFTGLLENEPGKLGSYVDTGSTRSILESMTASFLIGRYAPATLVDWIPARLDRATYDEENQVLTATFIAESKFTVRAISSVKPATVTVDGETLEATAWSYNPVNRGLTIELEGNGKTTLQITYPGWMPPIRQAPEPAAKRPVPPALTMGLETMGNMAIPTAAFASSSASAEDNNDDYQVLETGFIDLDSFNIGVNEQGAWSPIVFGQQKFSFDIRRFKGVNFNVAVDQSEFVGCELQDRKSLPVNGAYNKLYFLMTAAAPMKQGAKIADVVVKYKDGSKAQFPLIYGQESGSWTIPEPVRSGRMAKLSLGGKEYGVYVSCWTNQEYEKIAIPDATSLQRPIRRIAELEFNVPATVKGAVLLAITYELEI